MQALTSIKRKLTENRKGLGTCVLLKLSVGNTRSCKKDQHFVFIVLSVQSLIYCSLILKHVKWNWYIIMYKDGDLNSEALRHFDNFPKVHKKAILVFFLLFSFQIYISNTKKVGDNAWRSTATYPVEVQPWTDGVNVDTKLKLDTTLNFDCH